ncbi:MAG TPA: DNA translocase FtsK 4TM domain-containing protein [Bacteroidia bacterium]|nr:DNA translocase FtsK 4TM domain-containing protein [Bacteroidia bacterium]
MSKGNTFKSSGSEEKKTRKRTKEKSGPGVFSNIGSTLRSEKFQKLTGLGFILTSIFLLIAFSSSLFTHKTDFDLVNGNWFSMLLDKSVVVENWIGKFGAISSYFFFENMFGISSFVFVFMAFVLGFKMVFNVMLVNWNKSFKYCLMVLMLFPALLSFAFQNNSEVMFLGGGFGYQTNVWLSGILGRLGAGILLSFLFLAFAFKSIGFNVIELIKGKMNATKDADITEEEAIPSLELGNVMKDGFVNENVSKPIEFELEEEEKVETNSIESEVILDLDTPFETEPEPNTSTHENIEFDTVLPPEEDEEPVAHQSEPLNLSDITPDNILEKLGEFDPTLDLSKYQLPDVNLLENHSNKKQLSTEERYAELEENKNKIIETLGHYNIGIEKIKATVGPTVTLFEIVPQAGIKISKIKNLEDDIALSLAALGIRIIAPMPGKGTIGIEVPNKTSDIISMRNMIASERFQKSDYELPIAFGKTISNEVFVTDLTKMPHLLMAGATGQGKSVGLNCILVSLLYRMHPSQVKFVLVDPKKVELTLFRKIERHFLAKLPGEEEAIITDTKKVVNTLNSLCIEMDQRYELLKEAEVRNIKEYNTKFIKRKLNPEKGHRYLPYIVLVVDEFADLIMTAGKEVETPISRLAQLARAIGIHLIIATQRPSVNIITGTIKANFPARIAFRVTSKIDSRTILDNGGADQLIGRGDMLFSLGADLIRLQCAFVDTEEVEQVTEFIGGQQGYSDAFLLPEYVGDSVDGGTTDISPDDRDPLFIDAARIVVTTQQGSASILQRKLKLGYNRAGRIIDQLEAAGVVGPFEGSKAREVRIKDELSLEQFLNPTE